MSYVGTLDERQVTGERPRRHTPRQQNDFYETPPHYLKALGSELHLAPKTKVIDACVGQGAIARWLRAEYDAWVFTNDIDPNREAAIHGDARDPEIYNGIAEWWITNPPFSIINDILQTALVCVPNVITLGRLSVLEPTKGNTKEIGRRDIFKMFGEPKLTIVLPRYQFTKPSKDTMTCAWFGWGDDVPNIFKIVTDDPLC